MLLHHNLNQFQYIIIIIIINYMNSPFFSYPLINPITNNIGNDLNI